METCKLCGNPHKEISKSCLFCTGDQRKLYGIDVGAMYHTEYIKLRLISYLFPPTWLLLRRAENKKKKKMKNRARVTSNTAEIQGDNSFRVGLWGGVLSGKTWLLYAFAQEVARAIHRNLEISLIEGKPFIDEVYAGKIVDREITFPFPIQPNLDIIQKEFHLLRQKKITTDRNTLPLFEPGVNSHINEIITFDDTGGWLFDRTTGAKLVHLSEEQRDKANLSRQRIADCNYIVLLVGGTDNPDALFSGLSDLVNRITKQVKQHNGKNIAICLNKVERKPGFIAHWKEPQKLRGKNIFKSLLLGVFGVKKSNMLMDKFSILETLPLTTVKFFVISSCGYCIDEKTPNLDPAQNNQAPLDKDNWKPINVMPVFEWFFNYIETKRIDCRSEIFSELYKLPGRLANHSQTPFDQRKKDYIRYSKDLPYTKSEEL